MTWTNFHMHSTFCDGDSDPRIFIEEAIKQGMNTIGFSSHAPLPFPEPNVLDGREFGEYLKYHKDLKDEFENKIRIFTGLEFDFTGGWIADYAAEFIDKGLDYSLGSIHFFASEKKEIPYMIDGPADNFAEGIKVQFGGSVEKAVSAYYSDVRTMIKNYKFDIIGHLDLVKKNNNNDAFFSEKESWYIREIKETINAVKTSGHILEINTGGINRKKINSIYPSPWILELCFEKKIPLTLNSDTHSPRDITGYFEQAARIIHDIGYRELFVLTEKGWKAFPFTPAGIQIPRE